MNKLILAVALTVAVPLSFAEGLLENPVVDSTESGIGVISGWHCTATHIDITIDGMSLGKAGSGTSRNDTVGICGRADSGYSLLYNYNDLPPGSHTISAYADGKHLKLDNSIQFSLVGKHFLLAFPKQQQSLISHLLAEQLHCSGVRPSKALLLQG